MARPRPAGPLRPRSHPTARSCRPARPPAGTPAWARPPAGTPTWARPPAGTRTWDRPPAGTRTWDRPPAGTPTWARRLATSSVPTATPFQVATRHRRATPVPMATRSTPRRPWRRRRSTGRWAAAWVRWRHGARARCWRTLAGKVAQGDVDQYQPVPLGLHAARQDHRRRPSCRGAAAHRRCPGHRQDHDGGADGAQHRHGWPGERAVRLLRA